MREFTLEQLTPTRQQIRKINKELLLQRVNKVHKHREGNGIMHELPGGICLNNWAKLVKQGKIVSLGLREWSMEWDN